MSRGNIQTRHGLKSDCTCDNLRGPSSRVSMHKHSTPESQSTLGPRGWPKTLELEIPSTPVVGSNHTSLADLPYVTLTE